MKKPFVALLLLIGAAAMVASSAFAQTDELGVKLVNAKMVKELLGSRAARLSVSAGPDPDTVYVGKSFSNHIAPDNYWNIYTGSYLPGIIDPNNAYWDWDNSVGVQAADSLQGWWPLHLAHNLTGGLTLPDDQRPWWALDHGNLANYVISQQAAAKRTFGVVGIWHADPGKNVNPAGSVPWTPLAGTKSAWCGLRQHADNTVLDATTRNPFNQNVVWGLHAVSGTGTANRFPGYPDQIDQMLYRDIAMLNTQSLTVSFKYRTRMSTSIGTAANTRTGWFHGDPLAVVPGNFISSTAAGAAAPTDSFMVYVGAPVNDNAAVYSDGTTRPVYDKQRRWFSEVLKVFGAGNTYYEIFKAAGNNPADTLDATPTASATVPAVNIAAILSPATSGNVRLVFRCKTNRGFADSDFNVNAYSSFGYGAVLIDDVSVDKGAGAVVIGDFEGVEQGGVNQIDNRFPLPPGLTATDVWRSTGKPPGEYFHIENLANVTYNDLCGPPTSSARFCNIGGQVITLGNHDDGEGAGDSRFLAFREIQELVMSPTINLLGSGPGGATPNSMGITNSIASASDDIIIWYDIYMGMFNLNFTGNAWSFGSQSYPARQAGNGGTAWGQPVVPGFIVFNPEPQCITDFEPFFGNGQAPVTSNASGIPDSIRFFFNHIQTCYRFSISLGCNSNEGGYFDNATLAFVDLPGVPGQASAGSAVALGSVSADIWQFVNDTFPANITVLPGTANYDTTGALIRGGLNIAQSTGNAQAFNLPADSVAVIGANATVGTADDPNLRNVRVDLVFRILPGPGNYQIAGGRNMTPGGVPTGTLLQVPQNQGAVAVAGDASFWGQYMANPGEVSAGTHNGGASWDPLTWNSARCDTAEINIFRVQGGAGATGLPVVAGRWINTYHEADPKFTTLGVVKNRCFSIDTTKAANGLNVQCNGVAPAWITTVPQSRTGYDGLPTRIEGTKIIPDGLLTPGSHVQYFLRKSHAISPFLNFAMVPDTNRITPQSGEGNTDQHRWQQFSVLPDRWKAQAFGGKGDACMLYVDNNDRRGNEGRFVAVMDSIGGTEAAKRGAHNGWTAPGTTDILGIDVRLDPTVRVSNKNSQPGTTWDMYGVKAAESLASKAHNLGSRLSNTTGLSLAAGRENRNGPTPATLRGYYKTVAVLTGDLNSAIWGPFANNSSNDLALLDDYLTAVGGTPQPRGLLVQGDGFGQGELAAAGQDPAHSAFYLNKLGADFRAASYQSLAVNLNDCADLITTTTLTPNVDVYGVSNSCLWSNDVWRRNAAIPEAVDAAFYENVGINGPYVSDVVKLAVPTRNWIAVTSGYEIEHLFSRYCDTDNGRLAYYYYMLNKVFGGVCQLTGAPVATLDAPGGRGYANFMKIGNSVMKQGMSAVHFSVAKDGRVQVSIFDVTGRKVRNLADRVFSAGEHTIQWDGSDDSGSKVARGVYFVRSSVQKDAGRIIVLNN